MKKHFAYWLAVAIIYALSLPFVLLCALLWDYPQNFFLSFLPEARRIFRAIWDSGPQYAIGFPLLFVVLAVIHLLVFLYRSLAVFTRMFRFRLHLLHLILKFTYTRFIA